MCRMVAKASAQIVNPTYELLTAPHSLRQQSCESNSLADTVCTGEHRDGSGVAWFEDQQLHIDKRGSSDCWDGSFCDALLEIRTQMFIGHNRKASPGLVVRSESAHPFEFTACGGVAAFCHNGGITSLMREARERATTDSLVFAEFLGNNLHDLSLNAVASVVQQGAQMWEFSSLNAFLLTPHALFAWRCFEDNHERWADFDRYYTLYRKVSGDSVTIASEPVDGDAEWRLMRNRSMLMAWHDGEQLRVEEGQW